MSEVSAGAFPATQWTLVDRAARDSADGTRPALSQILQRYLPALKAHLIHRWRMPPERAETYVQSFIASRVLEQNIRERGDKALDKFRTVLLTSMENFVRNEIERENAREHAPAGGWSGIDASEAPPASFEVAWARQVLSQAIDRMKRECETSNRADVWGVFDARILKPCLGSAEMADYDTLCARFGFTSLTQASNVLVTAKRMFDRNLRGVMLDYCGDEAAVEQELRDLREILSNAGA